MAAPHGGSLLDRTVAESEVPALRERARTLPQIILDAREQADLELIGVGAASPLRGFLCRDDYLSVLAEMRLRDGTVWPLPLNLAVDERSRKQLHEGQAAALLDAAGELRGVIAVEEIYDRDVEDEARQVYGTDDRAHPGVGYLYSRPRGLVGGQVQMLPLPDDVPFRAQRLTPRELRREIEARGWGRVAGFQTRNPMHRAHEYLTKIALEVTDGLVLHPLVGETKGDDLPAAVRLRAYQALVERYYPRDRTLLAVFPAAMRYAGPREALFHALVRKNYGITHLIVGRDHAGVGRFYAPFAAQQIFDRFRSEEIGVTPLRLDEAFHCRACDGPASARTCPHGPAARLVLSGTRVREILAAGGDLPPEFTRPEVAAILREHYAAGATSAEARGPRPLAASAPLRPCGPIVWFTGLPGAGKTTLARGLAERLSPDVAVEVLDGDEVRAALSPGLGFSREDRDANIRRVGYVARLLARNGVTVITATISPYAATRQEMRRAAEQEGIPFLEVFADAPTEALARRDVKGLYAKARSGEITRFTGVSDPYEPPAEPDVHLHTDRELPRESLDRVIEVLSAHGLPARP